MNYFLSPSILAADFSRLGEDINKVENAGVKYLHIDVMDGIFVPSISFGMPVIKSIRKASGLFFDVHLMIKEPVRYIKDFKEAGADLLTIHVEACEDVKATIAAIRAEGMKVGISLNPETEVEKVLPYIPEVDMVLVMSVHPGFGGQKFIPETLEKMKAVRKAINELNPSCDLEVDGGINSSNIKNVIDAGVNVVVAGTAVFAGDIEKNVRSLQAKMTSNN